MPSNTVRIDLATHQRLRELASTEGKTMAKILGEAVEQYRCRLFLEQANTAYAALRQDPTSWNEELAERQTWDETLTDGQKQD